MSAIWKTKDCFACPLKRKDACYWGVEVRILDTYYTDGAVHKRKNCLKRWKPQPEGHVDLPEKGGT